MKYRQKRVVIDAWQWDGSHDLSNAPQWIHEAIYHGKLSITHNYQGKQTYMTIHKNQGSIRGYPKTYIVMGINKGLYFCKPDTFLLSHERLN
jgi:hypothetical protein